MKTIKTILNDHRVKPFIKHILFSILFSYAITLNLIVRTSEEIDKKLLGKGSALGRLFYDLQQSSSSNHTMLLCLACSMFIYFRYAEQFRPKVKFERKHLKIGAFLIALMYVVGLSISIDGTLAGLYMNYRSIIKSVIVFLGVYIFAVYAFYIIYHLIGKAENPVILDNRKRDKRIMRISLVAILLCWLPYIIAFYPGMLMMDTCDQLLQANGFPCITYNNLAYHASDTVFLNDSNPVFNTVVVGFFFKFGKLIGNQNLGIFFYSIIQVLMTAAIFSYSIVFAYKKGISKHICIFGILFYAIMPLFPTYAYTVVKNSLASLLIIAYMFVLYDVIFHTQEFIQKKWKMCLFVALSLLSMLNNKSGMYIMLLSGIVLCIAKRKYWKQLLLIVFVPILMFQAYTSFLLPAFNVSPGKSEELYSIPYQQTARYVRDHGDKVTEEERKIIDKVLIYDKLAENYNPLLSDGIKGKSCRMNHTSEEKKEYLKVWFIMFWKQPVCYMEATLQNTYYQFFPNISAGPVYTESMKKCSNYLDKYSDDGYFKLGWVDGLEQSRVTINQWIKVARKLPILGILSNIGLYTWILLILTVIAVAKRKYKLLLLYSPHYVNLLICFAGPYGSIRYTLPTIYCAFFLLVVTIHVISKKDTEEEEKCCEKEVLSDNTCV